MSTEKPLPEIKFIGRTVRSERGMSLIVVLMLMVIILAITGAGLLFSGIELRVSGNYRAGTQAFYAADTGASDGFSRIVASPVQSTQLFSGTLNGGLLTYCSGTILATVGCATPKPLGTPSTLPAEESTLSSGPVYNSDRAGFITYQYQIDVTGVGPLGSARQVQALATFGPVQ